MDNQKHKLKIAGVFIFFISALSLFLWDLITMKGSFVAGDYSVQFYPWSMLYSEAVKNFQFPFWVREFHSGFPLMAEGQIGGFYPLNIIMFFVLPFKFAYNYSIIMHFVFAAVFTYMYTRKLGAKTSGAAIAALCFCFGSSYAGCFYNIITLKTLAWFPLVFFLIESFFDSKKMRYILAAAMIAGMQFLAGFFQMAAYAFLFYLIYLVYGFKLHRIKLASSVRAMFLFLSIGTIILLPQFLLSYQLSNLTNRAKATLDFALWGSFPPPCLLSVIFPRWMGFLGPKIYIGILSIFFVIYAATLLKIKIRLRPMALIGLLALFFALGKYNPLYSLLVKLSGLYSFRNPSKFLFFAAFAGSVFAGFGFSEFFASRDEKLFRWSRRIFYWLIAVSAAVFFAAKFLLSVFKDKLILMLQDYAAKNVFGKPYHKYDLASYMEKAKSVFMNLLGGTNLADTFVLLSFVMIAASLLLVILLSRKPNSSGFLKRVAVLLILADLYAYSFYGTGFRGNIKNFDFLTPKESSILQFLKADKELFRICPFDLTGQNLPFWVRPNSNILVGIDSVAAYTPLALDGYKKALSSLEVVDDSLGLTTPNETAIIENSNALRLLNVKYVICAKKLKTEYLEPVISENNIFLYRFKRHLPRIFFTSDIKKNIEQERTASVKIIEYKNGFARVSLKTDKDGFLVFSENYYPGWQAYIDGQRANIVSVKNIIQAIKVKSGHHEIVFRFEPEFL